MNLYLQFFTTNTWLVYKKDYISPLFNLTLYYHYITQYKFYFLFFHELKKNIFFKHNNCILNYILNNLQLSSKPIVQENYPTKFYVLHVKNHFTKIKQIKFSNQNPSAVISTFSDNYTYMFNLFFLMGSLSLASNYKLHHGFNLIGITQLKNRQIFFEPKKFFKKWQSVYLFLFNMSYFNDMPLVFSSPILRRETLSINWYFHQFSMMSWRYSRPYFLFRTTIHSKKIDRFFEKLKNNKLNFALVTDTEYHFKLLHYFNKYRWYTIGFVSGNTDPWAVSFTVPVLRNTLFMQLFAIKFLFLARKNALYQKFLLHSSLWIKYNNTSIEKYSLK